MWATLPFIENNNLYKTMERPESNIKAICLVFIKLYLKHTEQKRAGTALCKSDKADIHRNFVIFQSEG